MISIGMKFLFPQVTQIQESFICGNCCFILLLLHWGHTFTNI